MEQTDHTIQDETTQEQDQAPTYTHLLHERFMKRRQSKSGKTLYRKIRKGDLVALLINGRVSIGWSLCHKKDSYDFVEGDHRKGFGFQTAINRAVKWADADAIEVPPSIFKQVVKFTGRCSLYYKDKDLPTIFPQIVEYPEPDDNIEPAGC
jgi:hypothetical protein